MALFVVVLLIGGTFGYLYLQLLSQASSVENGESQLRSSLANMTSGVASINSQLADMTKQQNAAISSEIKNESALMALLKEQNATLSSEIQSDFSNIASLTQQIRNLSSLATKDSTTINDLKQQLATMASQMATLQKQQDSTNAEMASLLRQVQELEVISNRLPTVKVPVTIATDVSSPNLVAPHEREAFVALGLYWVVESNPNSIIYQTSHDGVTWSLPLFLRSGTLRYSFSIWHDSITNTIYYVLTDGKTAGFWYRWGLLNPAGVVGWSVNEGFVATGANATYPYIYGTSDNIWVSLSTGSGSTIEVWNYNGAAWTSSNQINNNSGGESIVLPLSSGVALLYQTKPSNVASSVFLTITHDGGRTWSPPFVSSQTPYADVSAVSAGNVITYIGIDSSSRLYATSCIISNSTASSVSSSQIAQGVQTAAITSDGGSPYSRMAIVYSESQSSLQYALGAFNQTSSTGGGGGWQNYSGTISGNDNGIGPTISVEANSIGGVVPVVWGAGPNVNGLRFATVVL
jgi:hypothetical protein